MSTHAHVNIHSSYIIQYNGHTHTSQLVKVFVDENNFFAGKVLDLRKQIVAAKKEAKINRVANENKMQQITDKLDNAHNKTQNLKKKLVDKTRLINDMSSTHMTCRDIVSKYQNIQNQVVKKDIVIADLRNQVLEKENVIIDLRWRGGRGVSGGGGIKTLTLTLTHSHSRHVRLFRKELAKHRKKRKSQQEEIQKQTQVGVQARDSHII